jgi:hypothetical protein
VPKYYGRKVKRSKNLYKKKKSGFRKAVETVVFGAVVAGLVFVGYIVADTLRNYTPPEPPDPVVNPVTGEPVNGTQPPPEITTAPEHTTPPPPVFAGSAVYARSGVLASSTALRSYLKEEKSRGFGSIVIEMKDEDGRFLYKSTIEAIEGNEEIVTGTLTAQQIVEISIEEGFRPIARINTLKDRVSPTRMGASYHGWLDNTAASGGKRWMNPFSDGAVNYTSLITAELLEAGFADVIFANTKFPFDVFRGVDVSILPAEVTNTSTNFTGLGSFVNGVSQSVKDANILLEIMLDCLVGDSLTGTAAVLRNGGNSLNVGGIVLVFSRAYFDSPSSLHENATIESVTESAFAEVRAHSGDLDIIPVLDGTGISEGDRVKITEAFVSSGFENFIIRN